MSTLLKVVQGSKEEKMIIWKSGGLARSLQTYFR